MKKLVLGALLGALAIGYSPAQAQYFPPATTPYIRQPFLPYTGTPGPYSAYGSLFGGFYGPTPYGTAPYGASPYNVVPNVVGPNGLPVAGAPGTLGYTTANVVGLNDPNVTGHPTRFFYYNGYFFNQGAAVGLPLPNTQPILGSNPTTAAPLIGTAPLRGRANTQPGK